MADESGKKPVAFKADLIEGYHDAHRELLAILAEIVDATDVSRRSLAYGAAADEIIGASEVNKRKVIANNLRLFEKKFVAHTIDEKFHLYLYLKALYKTDDKALELIRQHQKEMDNTRRDALELVEWGLDDDADHDDEFLARLVTVTEAVRHRFAADEGEVYPLYKPAA